MILGDRSKPEKMTHFGKRSFGLEVLDLEKYPNITIYSHSKSTWNDVAGLGACSIGRSLGPTETDQLPHPVRYLVTAAYDGVATVWCVAWLRGSPS